MYINYVDLKRLVKIVVQLALIMVKIVIYNGPYAKFLNRAHLFFKRGAGDLIFTTCDCYDLNNVVFNFGAHT